jgi:hypothetical protein
MIVMIRNPPGFQYGPERGFRGWMRVTLINK